MREAVSFWPLVLVLVAVVVLVNSCSTGAIVERRSRAYFEQRLDTGSSTKVGMRVGRECAAAVFRAPDGRRRGVAVVLGGADWGGREVVGMSAHFQLRDLVDDGDARCGLRPDLRRQPDPLQRLLVLAAYRYVVRVDCHGPELRVDGSTWQLADPWRGDRRLRADVLDGRHGYLTLINSGRAVFRDVRGRVARFTRLPADVSHRACD